MIYPTERDTQEFMAKQPHEVTEEFRPSAEDAQREYRRARLENPGDEERQIGILVSHAGDVFKTLAARRLRTRSGDFAAFQREIGTEGGDAETAMWFAHDLYRLSGDGRMLAIWHRKIDLKISHLVRQAEDAWWLPDLVPEGWEEFLGEDSRRTAVHGSVSAQPSTPGRALSAAPAPANPEDPGRTRRAFVLPILEQKGWSITQWAVEAGVDFHTANDYLEGRTTPRASTRAQLARSLSVSVDKLPR